MSILGRIAGPEHAVFAGRKGRHLDVKFLGISGMQFTGILVDLFSRRVVDRDPGQGRIERFVEPEVVSACRHQ
jgi:hypothetical protein